MKLQLILATGNPDKVREIREILNDPSLTLLSMTEAGLVSDPVENGATFEENALIKVRSAASALERTGCPHSLNPALPVVLLADDSGLEVDALGGAPGILSARYLGRDTDYDFKMHSILSHLEGLKGRERSARFTCSCAAMVFSESPSANWSTFVVTRSMEGEIATEIAGEGGFGYDPFFFLPQYGKTSAEITEEEKNAISHRGQAFRAMLALLQERFSS